MITPRSNVVRTALDAAAGAAVGAAATVPMSVVMLLVKRSGRMGELPPRRVTDEAIEAVDEAVEALEVDPPEPARKGLTALNHLAFGAAAGVPFAVAHRWLPSRVLREPLGVVYALGIWASAYLGWVPALGIMPSAERDRPGRPAGMIAAHLVYGAALGAGVRLLRRR